MNQHVLLHQAASAIEKIKAARTPMEKHFAREDGLRVKADLEKHIADEAALKAFAAVQPRSTAGTYKGMPRFFFMVPKDGKKQTALVTLPDGSSVTPIQSQIPVPEEQVPAMTARGWTRANSVTIDLNTVNYVPMRSALGSKADITLPDGRKISADAAGNYANPAVFAGAMMQSERLQLVAPGTAAQQA
jgi:hypothetical protein